MNPNIAIIVDRMKNGNYRQRDEFVSVQMADLAEVMALVAEDQTASTEKLGNKLESLHETISLQIIATNKQSVVLTRLTYGAFFLGIVQTFFAVIEVYK